MTNTKLLTDIIKEKGIKKGKIIEILGISYKKLRDKINNKDEFTASEIQVLCDILGIKSKTLRDKIFFVINVGK